MQTKLVLTLMSMCFIDSRELDCQIGIDGIQFMDLGIQECFSWVLADGIQSMDLEIQECFSWALADGIQSMDLEIQECFS